MMDLRGKYRRNGKNVYIKQPELHELAFVSKLWTDEETMKDIGGVFNFPESRWEMFYKKMVCPTDGKNFYCLVYNTRDKAIGEVSFHGYDSATRIARFNVKIHHRYRNKGYGEEAVKLLLEYFFFDFGGEMIMDNISTEAGLNVANKLGFEVVRHYKDETAVRLSKADFLSKKERVTKKVAIILYNGMNMTDFALAYDIINSANKISDNKFFEPYAISFDGEIKASNGCVITADKVNIEEDNPHIIIIPGGMDVAEQVKDKEKIRYIMTHFNACDYICAQGEALKFLIRCRALDGIFIPRGQVSVDEVEEIEEHRIIEKNYIDNGKIMLSANEMGNIEMLLNLINKVGGKDLSLAVSKKVGLK